MDLLYDSGIMNCQIIDCSFMSGPELSELIEESKRSTEHRFDNKFAKQCDVSTYWAVKASRKILKEARTKGISNDRIGVFVGSCLGGIEFSEPQLKALHEQGSKKVSPYQVIAWFYAATQGQITINEKIGGFSKTFTGDSDNAVQALIAAAISIDYGDCDAALIIGSERCETPYYQYLLSSMSSNNCNENNSYEDSCGLILISKNDMGDCLGGNCRDDALAVIEGVWRVSSVVEAEKLSQLHINKMDDELKVVFRGFQCTDEQDEISENGDVNHVSGEIFKHIYRAMAELFLNNPSGDYMRLLQYIDFKCGNQYLISLRG